MLTSMRAPPTDEQGTMSPMGGRLSPRGGNDIPWPDTPKRFKSRLVRWDSGVVAIVFPLFFLRGRE